MKSLLDPTFRYTSSSETNLHKTFARIRREQKQAAARTPQQVQEAADTARIHLIQATRRIAK